VGGLGPKIKWLSGPDQQAQSYDLTLEAYSFHNLTLYIAAYPPIYNRHTQHLPYRRWSTAFRKSPSSSLFCHMWVIYSPSLPPSVHRHPQVFIFSFVPPYVSDFFSVPTSAGPQPSASLHLLICVHHMWVISFILCLVSTRNGQLVMRTLIENCMQQAKEN
jgi:hypothetical protein